MGWVRFPRVLVFALLRLILPESPAKQGLFQLDVAPIRATDFGLQRVRGITY